MRPLRLELEGFSSYRRKEELDLSGVEFFSISGPTGAGKSSLVDAMIFALYGRVPRLGGNAVAPALTAGAVRARVRFDFEVDNHAYTTVRLAERTKSGGATVREARLEAGDQVLAEGADEVTRAVTGLLSLGFDEFTRTVVLPQGEFARFLTTKKAKRQELLRSLLNLEIYGEVRAFARARQKVAEAEAAQAEARLRALTVPDESQIDTAKARLATLEGLAETVIETEESLRASISAESEFARELAGLEDGLSRLESLEAPEDMGRLEQEVTAARDELAEATKTLESAAEAVEARRAELEAFPSAEALESRRRLLAEIADVTTRLEEIDVEAARRILSDAEDALAAAARQLAQAEASLAEARAEHSAHGLASGLATGDQCPVCCQTVTTLPEHDPPPGIAELEDALVEARKQTEAATASRVAAATKVAEAKTLKSELQARLKALESSGGELAEADGPALDRISREVQAAEASLADAKTHHQELEQILRQRQRALEDATERLGSVGRLLVAARQGVSHLDPPLPESDDLIVQWKELLDWAGETTESLQQARADKTEQLASSREKTAQIRHALLESLKEVGVPVIEPYSVQVARETELARQEVARHTETVAEANRLREQAETEKRRAQVAAELAGHLGAAGFERWLMAGAMSDLVSGANHLLAQLSKEKYSLQVGSDGDFSIVDHTKAGETRPVSTLSGGETFLFSLALAMALAETLSAAGGARLDAIILDEGFGTLDDEPLDIVAGVLEELAAQDLMVGVITHVKELAARAPVRFEVTADPAGSKVVRVA